MGAFDRFNYGDILFAHLSEQIVRAHWPEAEISFFGTKRSDLRAEGGVKTGSLRDLFASPARADDVIWVAGGDVLSAPWYVAVQHSVSPRAARLMDRLRRRIGTGRLDRLVQRLARVPNRMPWIFDPQTFRKAAPRVIYLNVGGVYVQSYLTDWQGRTLARATWLSLRDRDTLAAMEARTGKSACLGPDSAVLMEDLAQAAAPARATRLAELLPRIAPDWAAGQRYLCLQCGINYLSGQEDVAVQQIKALNTRFGLPVVAFAIGRATGHEDHVSATRLRTLMAEHPWFHVAPDDLDIWQIMALIAGSAGYLGTSLHGFITAFVFGVPRVGLSPKVAKLMRFQKDWDLSGMPAGVALADMAEAMAQSMAQDPAASAAKATEAKAAARAGLAELWTRLGQQDGPDAGLSRP